MKIILLIIGCLVLIVLCVVAIGALLPKRHVASRSASFRATPDQLFSLISGPQNWRPDVLHCESVQDPSGRDLQRETTRDGQTISYELFDRTPPLSIKRRIVTEKLPFSGTWTFSLQPHDAFTTVRITEDAEVYNPVFRFMSRFVLGYTGTMDRYLRALATATNQDVRVID